MIILLCVFVVIAICSCLIFTETVWYDRYGMKYTLTDNSITAEWDFNNPITKLRLLKLFIDNESAGEIKNKYIRQYNRLKELLKDKYDMSDFPDYEIK